MENKKLGKVEINPSALSVIANIAATEVEGVSKLLGKKVYSHGVAKTARKIQENVKNSIFNMTEITTKSVNVNVLGIDF